MKYSCCIEMLFTEYEFAERIWKAKEAGFDCVEFWCWEDKDLAAIKKTTEDAGVSIAIMQGNTEGRMVDPKDFDKYIAGVRKSIRKAKYLGVKNLFLMSDIMREDRSVLETEYSISVEEKRKATIRILKELVPIAEENDITFVIEPLNTKVDHKGYSLYSSREGADIIKEVGNDHIRLLYDAYHMQIMEGNVIETIRELHDTLGYFHIADVPGRCQPGTGELNYVNIVKALKETGYDRYVGFEFEAAGVSSMDASRECLNVLRNVCP